MLSSMICWAGRVPGGASEVRGNSSRPPGPPVRHVVTSSSSFVRVVGSTSLIVSKKGEYRSRSVPRNLDET